MSATAAASCCRAHAADRDARTCPDCGAPLLRCAGFERCGALVDAAEYCPVHVAPRLFLARGAATTARVGQQLSLPLLLANASPLPGTLHVQRVLTGAPGRNLEEQVLHWDHLRSGEEKAFTVDSGVLEAGGRTRLDVVVIVSSAPAGQGDAGEESHAFAASLLLQVDEADGARQITQHIHIEGGHFEAGASAVVQTGPSIQEGSTFAARGAAPDGRVEVAQFQRADALELRLGVRGYTDPAMVVPRHVRVLWQGFRPGEVPTQARPFLDRRELACGRNSREAGERNPQPNDVVLRAYDAASGEIDRDRSLRVSGRHLGLLLRNGRLMARALGSAPCFVDGEALPRGGEQVIGNQARIGLLGHEPSDLRLDVAFATRGRMVESITFTRTGR